MGIHAQTWIDPGTAGTTYVIAFPDTVSNSYDQRQDTDPTLPKRDPRNDSVFVIIYSPTANSITITGNKGYATSLTMKAGGFQTVWLNGTPRAASPICDDIGIVSDKTFRIEAASPVIVYGFIATKFGTEAFTPLPVETWGTEYYAAATPGEVLYDETPTEANSYGKRSKAGPAEILVIAAYDNTKLTIVPNGRLSNNPPTTVTLMKNQCYQVRSYVDTMKEDLGNPQADIGGSYLHATRPIGVISGNTRAQVTDYSGGLAKNSFKNMAIEWLAPVEQHGTTFVYLPTWDAWRPVGGEDPDGKRQGEVVRIYGTAGSPTDPTPTVTSGADINGQNGTLADVFSMPRTGFHEFMIGMPTPHIFTTSLPAEAYMTTTAAVKFNGTTGSGSAVGASYSAAATYMVGLTPREQWSYLAPYVTPTTPDSMSNYLNIVTDSLSRKRITIDGEPLAIDSIIRGSDLYWTSIPLAGGKTGIIRGADSSCRFYGFVYGGKTGGESLTTLPKGPALYQENIGFMYGYPLAARHWTLRPDDSLKIDSTRPDCATLTLATEILNQNPNGLSSIRLDSAINLAISFTVPDSSTALVETTKSQFSVTPIDKNQNASGIVVITDRSGKTWRIPYNYVAEILASRPAAGLDFGQIQTGTTSTRSFTIYNPTPNPIPVTSLLLKFQTYTITGTVPGLPTVLAPGDSIVVSVLFAPSTDGVFQDTIFGGNTCGRFGFPLNGKSSTTTGVAISESVAGYAFEAIEPNPFSASTKIGFTLGAGGATTVEIYDRTGARIALLADGPLDAGRHMFFWDGAGLPSGDYYCRIRSGRWSITRPILLVH